LHHIIAKELNLPLEEPNLGAWSEMALRIDNFERKVVIALVGKYTGLSDSYLSVLKSLKHAAYAVGGGLDLVWIEGSDLEQNDEEAWNKLKSADGVVVPGGFGNRGFLGKMQAANYCRVNKKPYLGICLGFQAMVVEFCRNAAHKDMAPINGTSIPPPQAANDFTNDKIFGWDDADSAEFNDKTQHPVVIFMPEIDKENMGGTMRLGARDTKISKHPDGQTSICEILYTYAGESKANDDGTVRVSERHRHRYEVNPELVDQIDAGGLHFVGKDQVAGDRMEIAEISRDVHPFYVGCQYHPEFKSRPLHPSPPFHGLLLASSGKLDEFLKSKATA